MGGEEVRSRPVLATRTETTTELSLALGEFGGKKK